MPRQTRLDAPGTLHHVMIRGIEGKSIFRDGRDRRDFVSRLGDLSREMGTPILAARGALEAGVAKMKSEICWRAFMRLPMILLLWPLVSGYAFADCAKDLHGKVFCGRGECARDINGNVKCSSYPFGGAIRDLSGNVKCGKGQCLADRAGNVICSAGELGGAVRDKNGDVMCGIGRCITDRFGNIYCSTISNGAAMIDTSGDAKCYYGCEKGTSNLCESASSGLCESVEGQ